MELRKLKPEVTAAQDLLPISVVGVGGRAWEGVGLVSLWNSGLRWGPWVRKWGWGGGGEPE